MGRTNRQAVGDLLHFGTVAEYAAFNNNDPQHPLVGVVELDRAMPRKLRRMRYGFYVVFLKQVYCGDLRYGLGNYDYAEGTLVFVAPDQAIGESREEYYRPQGLALVFHPDLLAGLPLGKSMAGYRFFSYAASEALHLSEQEKAIVRDCFARIGQELRQQADRHSRRLIASNIELFLNHCDRFYDRQFATRESVNKGVLERFESLLDGYFSSDRPQRDGLPSVSGCAEEMCLSAGYFGDLIRNATGKSAQEHIQSKIIGIAKERMAEADRSVSEIAYGMGFKYPQHFTRLFKQRTGVTPSEYRSIPFGR